MPLLLSKLEDGLRSALNKRARTASRAAQLLAEAYREYANDGTAAGFPPVFTGLEVGALQATLLGAISRPEAGNPPLFASAWSSGINAFWFIPPVIFSTGAVISVLGAAAIMGCLTPVFSNVGATVNSTAASMALCLHTATLTTTVFIPPSTTVTVI